MVAFHKQPPLEPGKEELQKSRRHLGRDGLHSLVRQPIQIAASPTWNEFLIRRLRVKVEPWCGKIRRIDFEMRLDSERYDISKVKEATGDVVPMDLNLLALTNPT